MARNIVICSDGTGNTFDGKPTNVTRLIECLALDPANQIAAYDQGVGTAAARREAVARYRGRATDPRALCILPGPLGEPGSLGSWISRSRGLLTGHGLKENVREMYAYLADRYRGPGDRVFLFGFSRGAFTVRALAGLVHRCRLPPKGAGASDVRERFERAWSLFEPIHPDEEAVADFIDGQRSGHIHFLGVWDTVKSCGGLKPVMLPHLRHNPIVAHARHALALDERRAWFAETTWGRLDLDRRGAMIRLRPEDHSAFARQTISEVWFTGCHSDVGGGECERETASIALRWMLGEAVGVRPPLELNPEGEALLAQEDPVPATHPSSRFGWHVAAAVPRLEIRNDGMYPRRRLGRPWGGRRHPEALLRAGTYAVHETVSGGAALPGGPEVVPTTRRSG